MKNIFNFYSRIIFKPGNFFIELTRNNIKVRYSFILIGIYFFLFFIINIILSINGTKYYLINFFNEEYYYFFNIFNIILNILILLLVSAFIHLSGKLFNGIAGFDDSFAITVHSLVLPGFFYLIIKIIVFFIIKNLFGFNNDYVLNLIINFARIITVFVQFLLLILSVKLSHIIKFVQSLIISVFSIGLYIFFSILFFI